MAAQLLRMPPQVAPRLRSHIRPTPLNHPAPQLVNHRVDGTTEERNDNNFHDLGEGEGEALLPIHGPEEADVHV